MSILWLCLLLLLSLLDCEGTGKGNKNRGGRKKQGGNKDGHRQDTAGRAEEGADQSGEAASSSGKPWDDQQPMRIHRSDLHNSAEPWHDQKSIRIQKKHLHKCAEAFEESFTVTNLQHQLAGKKDQFDVHTDLIVCHVTLGKFEFRGQSDVGIGEDISGVYLRVRQDNFSLCADMKIDIEVGHVSDETKTLMADMDIIKVGETKHYQCPVCVQPPKGQTFALEARFEIQGCKKYWDRYKLDRATSMDIERTRKISNEILMEWVGDEAKLRMIGKFREAMNGAYEEVLQKVDEIEREGNKAEQEMIDVVFKMDMGMMKEVGESETN